MKYINLFLLGFIVIAYQQIALPTDKTAASRETNKLFKEPAGNPDLVITNLPVYHDTVNTNLKFHVVVANEAQLLNLGVKLSDVTETKVQQDIGSKVSNTNLIRVARADKWEDAIRKINLEKDKDKDAGTEITP